MSFFSSSPALPPNSPPHPAVPPIYRMPPELLIDIFVHCSAQPSSRPMPVVLGQVCRYWKDVARLSPRIWQYLYLHESAGPAASVAQTRLWVERSVPLPLDVRVDAPNADMLLPILAPVLSNMQRLRRCVITGKRDEELDFAQYPFDRSRACLVDEMHVVIKGIASLDPFGTNDIIVDDVNMHDQDNDNDNDNDNGNNNDDGNTISDASHERTGETMFRVSSPADGGPPELVMHLTMYALPLASLMVQPIPIKYLSITEASLDVTTDVVRMLNFLQFTPLLETLHFAGWPQEGLPIQPGAMRCPVRLPHLRSLLIRGTVSVRAMLEHIDAPALEELFLEHTNVDFELRTEPYVLVRQKQLQAAGDVDANAEDDEPRDFSQSPWSDHATGMGLRALISRSRPPLRVLHMDYADMRTKDFGWCFDRLPLLEEFRIVGSDMSDRVVRMLAPFHDHGDRGHRCAAAAGTEGRRGHGQGCAVRLPSLRKLEVWHCQRISGDAVVQALRERVVYTDWAAGVAASGGRTPTLESVAIVGCNEFLFRHGQALGERLGERLRVS